MFIGDGTTCPQIVVTVVDIDRGKIRLGISCARDIPIMREELLPVKDQQPQAPTPPAAEGPAGAEDA